MSFTGQTPAVRSTTSPGGAFLVRFDASKEGTRLIIRQSRFFDAAHLQFEQIDSLAGKVRMKVRGRGG